MQKERGTWMNESLKADFISSLTKSQLEEKK
jgi:hypothetical protein